LFSSNGDKIIIPTEA